MAHEITLTKIIYICLFMIKTSGVRSGHASRALHDQIFRNCITNICATGEVDIVEKYYLFGMKSEADPRNRPVFFVLF